MGWAAGSGDIPYLIESVPQFTITKVTKQKRLSRSRWVFRSVSLRGFQGVSECFWGAGAGAGVGRCVVLPVVARLCILSLGCGVACRVHQRKKT